MMNAQWEYGEAVRLTRNVRNDGTYPGLDPGAPLVRRGSVGYVVDVGTFLQDQIIYSVNFLDEGKIVGCREEELIDADDEWVESRFETRERVHCTRALAIEGEVRVAPGSRGEILKVLRHATADEVLYHVHFECLPGHPLIVRENALTPAFESEVLHA